MLLIPVILSGGVGSRLWPLSREHYPKQVLALLGEHSLLQNTVKRLNGINHHAPLVVGNEQHRFLIAEQLRQLGVLPNNLLLEPCGRNTAPAVAVAALEAIAKHDDALLLVLPADHLIQNTSAFHQAVQYGVDLGLHDHLVTFGIVPSHAETGYGYIKAAQAINPQTYHVAEFVEKPDAETAQRYIESGEYYWNSGMFLFKASVYLHTLQQHAPAILQACQQAHEHAQQDHDFLRLDKKHFTVCPSDSIDYAVMEHTDNAAVIPLDAGWSDIGAWSALWAVEEQDATGNVMIGDVISHDVQNCYLRSEYRLIAALGLRDHIVVETADAVLVAHKDCVQDVKQIVTQLKAEQRKEADLHRKVYRPWGTYENIDVEARFQVKRITVNPSASLSLQMHYHRSEHWVVVKGTAHITCGDKSFLLTENQSTYIPPGVKHRLANPGKLALEIIEIQSGSYLGEDDIVRFEDVYGRH